MLGPYPSDNVAFQRAIGQSLAIGEFKLADTLNQMLAQADLTPGGTDAVVEDFNTQIADLSRSEQRRLGHFLQAVTRCTVERDLILTGVL